MEKNEENQEKNQNNENFNEFLQKINPYRDLKVDPENGRIIETKKFVYYQKLSVWLIDVLISGLFINFILYAFGIYPLHWILVLSCGITQWLAISLTKRAWDEYISGKIKIERSK